MRNHLQTSFSPGFLSLGSSRLDVSVEEQDEHNGQAGQHHHGQEPGQGGQGGRQGDERLQGPKSLFSFSCLFLSLLPTNVESTSPAEAETI